MTQILTNIQHLLQGAEGTDQLQLDAYTAEIVASFDTETRIEAAADWHAVNQGEQDEQHIFDSGLPYGMISRAVFEAALEWAEKEGYVHNDQPMAIVTPMFEEVTGPGRPRIGEKRTFTLGERQIEKLRNAAEVTGLSQSEVIRNLIDYNLD